MYEDVVSVGVYAYNVCVGNEEEEEEVLDNDVLLSSSNAHKAASGTAADADNDAEVAEERQNSPHEESFVTESQMSPKCSPVLRNKVSLCC